jgi:hypothetical protein
MGREIVLCNAMNGVRYQGLGPVSGLLKLPDQRPKISLKQCLKPGIGRPHGHLDLTASFGHADVYRLRVGR